QTRKGNQYFFGMKAHIGVDDASGLVHHVECTAANVADITQAYKLLHGVEYPFRVIKRQFGYVKVRYRGLVKKTAQVLTLFALSNLWLKRKQLMPAVGKVCL
ncbi:transposase, partial [Xanthomonas fragariae]|uniref:transposase n=1 Tax=Xanthomonas fragariae TaxID=48664 RepID=UPI003530DBA3